jgi:glycosyltransferase involved in cell wall biosynthesis
MNYLYQPLISVVIPCFNVAQYVEKAVGSILTQTYTKLEIWLIDDASKDNTLQIIHTINDDRIKVVAINKNTQKVGAVNDVLKMVNGDYIIFQDADDWSEKDRIEKQVNEFLKDNELGVCFTRYRFTGNKYFSPQTISLTNEELRNEFLNYLYPGKANSFPTVCGTMMISKNVLIKTGGYHPFFKGRVAEDIHWIYRILNEFKGITVDAVLYNYNVREGSFSQTNALGIKPKYAYSCHLLSKIIYKNMHEGIDVLAPENISVLKEMELDACEKALVEKIRELNNLKMTYENSATFKIGKLLLRPFRFLKIIGK